MPCKNQNPTDSDSCSATHCVHLFSQVYVDNLGFYQPCCHFRSKVTQDLNSWNHVTDMSPKEYLNSEEMKDFRRRCNEGEKLPECTHCFDLESLGAESMRVRDNRLFHQRRQAAGNAIEQDHLLSLDFRAGNLCNLGCVMCAPSASSKLDALWSQHGADKFARNGSTMSDYQLRVNVKDWYQDPQLYEKIVEGSEHLVQLSLIGGEPLASTHNLKLLKALKPRGKKLYLEITSNGSLVTPEIIELLKPFNTYFKFSMDGIHEVCEYIRYPSDFSVLESKLDLLLQNQISTGIISTISVLNLMNVKAHYLWTRKKAEQHEQKLYFYLANFVHEPDHLNVAHLPENLRQPALEQIHWIQQSLTDSPSPYLETAGTEKALLQYLKQSQGDPEVLRNGWKYIEFYDQVRGTAWQNIAPYLKDVISVGSQI